MWASTKSKSKGQVKIRIHLNLEAKRGDDLRLLNGDFRALEFESTKFSEVWENRTRFLGIAALLVLVKKIGDLNKRNKRRTYGNRFEWRTLSDR